MKKRVVWLSLAMLTIFSGFSMLFIAYAGNDSYSRKLGVESTPKTILFTFLPRPPTGRLRGLSESENRKTLRLTILPD